MTDHKIKRMNLGFIWTKTFFNLFESDAADLDRYPHLFFSKITKYKPIYMKLKSTDTPKGQLSLPWEKVRANYFWKHYFGEKQPWDLSPNLAWDVYQIPFRKKIKAEISTPWLKTKRAVTLEGFFYRHGVAAVISVYLRSESSLEKAVEKALQSRYSGKFEVKWPDGSIMGYSLTKLANFLLDSFCEEALGPAEGKGLGFSGDPFSIVSVIQGDQNFKNQSVKQGEEIHKALEALTKWNKDWPSANPPKLEEKKLVIKNQHFGNHYSYSNKQGRVIWFPKLFYQPKNGSKRFAMRWYHRNLVLASLQTASLGAFITHTADQIKSGPGINTYHTQWVRKTIKILDRLHNGEDTYRTWSARAQIEQNGFLESMKFLKSKL